eukprot:6046213-Karenia_brevis.AAC.1
MTYAYAAVLVPVLLAAMAVHHIATGRGDRSVKENKQCRLCEEYSDIARNQVLCDKNECKKQEQSAYNHSKAQGQVDFYTTLKTATDPGPWRKYMASYKRQKGPLAGSGKKRTG